MEKIIVSGLINIETTLKIDQFPLHYYPVTYPFHGIQSTISGVGLNLAKALTILGTEVNFLSIIGNDLYEPLIRNEISSLGIDDTSILANLKDTAQSVILYDTSGKRQIHTDLKDIQQRVYPRHLFEKALNNSQIALLCNINFNRQLLDVASHRQIPIATDVHAISQIDDEYNQEFMTAANILFLSHENLRESPTSFIQKLWLHYNNQIIVIGMGEHGAMIALKEENHIFHIPAIQVRPIINTIGAGDALFSSFVFSYLHTNDPLNALQHAVLFASHKIGTNGAANGFLTFSQLNELFMQHQNELHPEAITF